MAKVNGETWLCVICSLERHAFGQPCPTWQTTCENRERAHITGRWYLGQPLDSSQQLAIGIAAISDEDTKNDKHD